MAFVNALKDAINFLTAPEIFITVAAILFVIAVLWRGLWRPRARASATRVPSGRRWA